MFRYFVVAFFVTSSITVSTQLTTFGKVYGTKRCPLDQWNCHDGSCIPRDQRCDGKVDCPGGSDEMHAICGNHICAPNLFRCTYGACVPGYAQCDGVKDCVDGSDEIACNSHVQKVIDGEFKCDDGELIGAEGLCDGALDCADGSDETLEACAHRVCPPFAFQCAYGACVDATDVCDSGAKWHCADGSDESSYICNRTSTTSDNFPWSPPSCVLPAYPKSGLYSVEGHPNAHPGQALFNVTLTVLCAWPDRPTGTAVRCENGQWNASVPECKRHCDLTPHPSVSYTCLFPNNTNQPCERDIPSETVVTPKCKKQYKSSHHENRLPEMHCIDGDWDYVAICDVEPTDYATNDPTDNTSNQAEATNDTKEPDSVKFEVVGGNVTVSVNDRVFVYLTGNDYTVTVANASGTFASLDVPARRKSRIGADAAIETIDSLSNPGNEINITLSETGN